MFKIKSILVFGILAIFSMAAHADPSVSLSESKIKSRVGSIVEVDLMMSDFATTEGGGVELHYDSSLVQINSVVVDGTAWSFVSRDGDINNDDGIVSNILFSSYQGVSGNAKIATIELEFIGKGKGKIKLSEAASNPFASNGELIAVTYKSSKIRVRRTKNNRK
jgi:hypothetical protein